MTATDKLEQSDPIAPPPVRQVANGSALRWLRLGWRDLRMAGWPSLIHGLIVTVFSLFIVNLLVVFWPLLPGAISGFVVVGPILATGLYAISRRIEMARPTGFEDAINAWRRGTPCLYRFGFLLIVGGSIWVLVSMLLFRYFVETPIETPIDFLRYVVVQHDHLFLLWTILGGLVAAITFAATVVSVPMLVDRDVNTPLAMATSIRAVGENPIPMTLWALFLLLATGLSIATFMLGFIVLYPLMGHASWHVYRDLVDSTQLPPRRVTE